jgi:hypothetical protein
MVQNTVKVAASAIIAPVCHVGAALFTIFVKGADFSEFMQLLPLKPSSDRNGPADI